MTFNVGMCNIYIVSICRSKEVQVCNPGDWYLLTFYLIIRWDLRLGY